MSEIYQRRHRNLFRFFFRLTGRQATAEDLAHEVFLRMIQYRHTYQKEGGVASESFEAWMYRIARNAFADQTKKHRLETPGEDRDFEVFASDRPSAFDNVAKKQELALLYRALRELPENRRELIILSRFQRLTHEQIGQIVGCETGAAKVRVFRAIKEMAQIYTDLANEKEIAS